MLDAAQDRMGRGHSRVDGERRARFARRGRDIAADRRDDRELEVRARGGDRIVRDLCARGDRFGE